MEYILCWEAKQVVSLAGLHLHCDLAPFITVLARELALALGLMFNTAKGKVKHLSCPDFGTVKNLTLLWSAFTTKTWFTCMLETYFSSKYMSPLILHLQQFAWTTWSMRGQFATYQVTWVRLSAIFHGGNVEFCLVVKLNWSREQHITKRLFGASWKRCSTWKEPDGCKERDAIVNN